MRSHRPLVVGGSLSRPGMDTPAKSFAVKSTRADSAVAAAFRKGAAKKMGIWASSHPHNSSPRYILASQIAKGARGVIMIIARSVALVLGLAVAASNSFAQVRKPLPAPSVARTKAIRDCTAAAGKYIDHVWGDWEINVYR